MNTLCYSQWVHYSLSKNSVLKSSSTICYAYRLFKVSKTSSNNLVSPKNDSPNPYIWGSIAFVKWFWKASLSYCGRRASRCCNSSQLHSSWSITPPTSQTWSLLKHLTLRASTGTPDFFRVGSSLTNLIRLKSDSTFYSSSTCLSVISDSRFCASSFEPWKIRYPKLSLSDPRSMSFLALK